MSPSIRKFAIITKAAVKITEKNPINETLIKVNQFLQTDFY